MNFSIMMHKKLLTDDISLLFILESQVRVFSSQGHFTVTVTEIRGIQGNLL